MSQDDNYFDNLDEHLEYAEEQAQEEKTDWYIDEAREKALQDKNFLQDLKMELTDQSNYFHSFYDSKYSRVEILRDKKNHLLLRGTFRLPIEGLDILGLKREYPNSHIRVINYEGKIDAVEVTEQYQIEK